MLFLPTSPSQFWNAVANGTGELNGTPVGPCVNRKRFNTIPLPNPEMKMDTGYKQGGIIPGPEATEVWYHYEVVSDNEGIFISVNTWDRDARDTAAYWAGRHNARIRKVRYERPVVATTRTVIEDPVTEDWARPAGSA